jgi:hypothetical protein
VPAELFVFDPDAGLFGATKVTGAQAAAGRFAAELAAGTEFFAQMSGIILATEADVFAAFALAAGQAAAQAADDGDAADETIAGVSVRTVTIDRDKFTVAVRVRTNVDLVDLSFPVHADLTEV